MSKGSDNIMQDYLYTQNRELSWLRFNRRVLEEAEDATVPALERLKFISIFSTNLDEFFMIRVGSLFDLSSIAPDEVDNKSGMTPAEQLNRIYETIPGLIERKKRIYASVCQALLNEGIKDVSYNELKHGEEKYVARYFQDHILPGAVPADCGQQASYPSFSKQTAICGVSCKGKK